MVWLLIGSFCQLYLENQEEIVQQNDFKSFEFSQKRSCGKATTCKDRAEENFVIEETSIKKPYTLKLGNRIDGLNVSQKLAEHPLQPPKNFLSSGKVYMKKQE